MLIAPTPPPILVGTPAGGSPAPQSPALPVTNGLSSYTPGVASAIAAGDTGNLLASFNRNAVLHDALARSLGYGVLSGFTLGTPVAGAIGIGAGVALLDGVVTIGAQQLATSASQTGYVWVRQSGVPQAVILYGALGPGPPTGGPALYVGAVTTDASNVVTGLDTSGVTYCRALLYRETGDVGAPSDTPSLGTFLLSRNPSGLWLWDGKQWSQTTAPGPGKPARVAAGSVVITGTTTSLSFAHGLSSFDVSVTVWSTGATRAPISPSLSLPDANTVTLSMAAGAFASGAYRVVVTG